MKLTAGRWRIWTAGGITTFRTARWRWAISSTRWHCLFWWAIPHVQRPIFLIMEVRQCQFLRCTCTYITRSSAIADRPRDALWPPVHAGLVSFKSTTPWAQSFSISYFGFRFTTVYNKCSSVVFGIALMLLVINTSSSSPVNNKRGRLQEMSVTNLPWSGATLSTTLAGRAVDNTQWIAIFAYPTCIRWPR